MKLKKKSGLIGIVVALSAASLISVGFASWVISQGDTQDVTGTIDVDTVSDQRHMITATWVTDSSGATPLGSTPKVVYGYPATMNASNPWLTNDQAGSKQEALTFYLKVQVSNTSTSDTVASVVDSITVTSTGGGTVDTDKTGYAGANTLTYVAALPTPTTAASNFNASSFVVYTISFGWGSKFGGSNPYNYYNDGAKTAATYGDDAMTALGNLNTLLTNATFTVRIVTK